MTDAPISVFISYSRTDSAFIDRLEADLRAYGFTTWVDRQHLEGGADWARVIEQQILGHEAFVVALSPDAIVSNWVRNELTFALNTGRRIVPVIVRPVERAPIEIINLQYIDLGKAYADHLQELRLVLLKTRDLPPPPKRVQTAQPMLSPDLTDPLVGLVGIPAALPSPNADLNAIFMQAQSALAHRSLDLAEALLRQVVEKDPHFGNDLAAEDLERVREQLGPIQIERLRKLATEAHTRGAWGEEIGALRALADRLSLAPAPASGGGAPSPRPTTWGSRFQAPTSQGWGTSDLPSGWGAPAARDELTLVRDRLKVAEECQKWAWLYGNARAFIEANDTESAVLTLKRLWEKAPSYGDPAHIAPAGTTPPEITNVVTNDSIGASPYLIVQSGPNAGARYPIQKDRITIGRHRDSDIFSEDLALSRLHTSILRDPAGQCFVRDENSANGTSVNGQRVTTQLLRDGDVIQIGQTSLLFTAQAGAASAKETPKSVACPSCGALNSSVSKFCSRCGYVFPIRVGGKLCPDCGIENPAGNRRCGACGAHLA